MDIGVDVGDGRLWKRASRESGKEENGIIGKEKGKRGEFDLHTTIVEVLPVSGLSNGRLNAH